MYSAIAPWSSHAAQTVASVWNRKLPSPISPISAASTRASRARGGGAPAACRQTIAAAIRNAAFVRAFAGSAQKPGSVRSQ